MPAALTSPLKRLSRPTIPRPFRITHRDVAMLEAVARYRFLSSAQLWRLVGGSERNVRNRLRALFAHGYLERPAHQYANLLGLLNPPLVYGLGKQGARLLADLGAAIDQRLDWKAKNARATSPFLAHTLEVAETMMAFTSACHGVARLIDHHELLPFMPEATRDARDPFALRVRLRRHSKEIAITVVPDRLFSLVLPANLRFNFALELDRGTMDITACRLIGKSSFQRKLIGYGQAWQQKLPARAWGFKTFRVLTVTPSQQRIAHMISAQCEVMPDGPSGLFLYTTPQRLARFGALGPAWISSKSDGVALIV